MIDWHMMFLCFAPMVFWAFQCRCCFTCFECSEGAKPLYVLEITGVVNDFCTDCNNVNGTFLLAEPGTGTCVWLGGSPVVCTTSHGWRLWALSTTEDNPTQYASPQLNLFATLTNVQWKGDDVAYGTVPCNFDGKILTFCWQRDLDTGPGVVYACDYSGATATLMEA